MNCTAIANIYSTIEIRIIPCIFIPLPFDIHTEKSHIIFKMGTFFWLESTIACINKETNFKSLTESNLIISQIFIWTYEAIIKCLEWKSSGYYQNFEDLT